MPSDKRARQRAMRQIKREQELRRTKRRRQARRALGGLVVVGIVIGLVVLLSGSKAPPKKPATTTTTAVTTTTTTVAPTSTTIPAVTTAVTPTCPPSSGSVKRYIDFKKAPPICISPTGVYDATVVTDVGTFVIRMDAASSVTAVNNFVFLSRYRYYDSTIFHRVIPGFVVQGGDPTGTGSGTPGYSWTGNAPASACATKKDCYPLYSVAMANTGTPASNGSQFFVIVGVSGEQLPPSYTLFGQVVSGTSVVQHIAADGNSNPAQSGVPPKITHHIVKVTISQVAA